MMLYGCSRTPTTVYKTIPSPTIPYYLKTPQCAPESFDGQSVGDLMVSWADNTLCADILYKQILHINEWESRTK